MWRLRLGALIMGKIDHETILTQTHLHPVIIYVVLNLQICLLQSSELSEREKMVAVEYASVCVCRRDTVLIN